MLCLCRGWCLPCFVVVAGFSVVGTCAVDVRVRALRVRAVSWSSYDLPTGAGFHVASVGLLSRVVRAPLWRVFWPLAACPIPSRAIALDGLGSAPPVFVVWPLAFCRRLARGFIIGRRP